MTYTPTAHGTTIPGDRLGKGRPGTRRLAREQPRVQTHPLCALESFSQLGRAPSAASRACGQAAAAELWIGPKVSARQVLRSSGFENLAAARTGRLLLLDL